MKTGLPLGIIANSKTRVRCVFCGVHIPKADKCIEQHTNGIKHNDNMELMVDNGIRFTNNVLFCKLCKVNLDEDVSVTKHIESEDHSNWIATLDDLIDGEFINIESYLSSEGDDVFCEVCGININCTLHNIQEHVNSFLHRSNVAERLKPLNGIFPVDNDDELWCKVCDVYINNNVQSVLDHIDGDDQHIEWFMEIEDLIEDQEVFITEYLSNEHEKYAHCFKCDLEILCNAQNIDDHINSEMHSSNFST